MKKTIIALLGAGALVLAPVAASATVPNPPAEEECIPQDAWPEVIEHPAVGEPTITKDNPDYVAEREETRIVEEAHWQRYSYTGKHEGDEPPAFPGPNWQANVKGDPHGQGVAGVYFVSNGNSGKGDWFALEWVPEVTEVVVIPAEGEPTIEVENPDYQAPRTETIEHEAVVCEGDEEPETPPFTGVTKYAPQIEKTCDTASWSHPEFQYPDGTAVTEYMVRSGATQAEAQAKAWSPYTPGEVVSVTFDDPTVSNTFYVEARILSEKFPNGGGLGQSRIVTEPCEEEPLPEPEEPEVPGDEEPGDTPGDDESGEETPAEDDEVETIRVLDGKGKALTIETKKLSTSSPTPPVQVDAGLAETGTGGYTALAFGIALIASGAVLAAKRAFRA